MGKTCLIKQYLFNEYTELYEPSVLDVYKGTKNISGHTVELEIHDTSGDEHLGTNRRVQYQGADGFMICVAANSDDGLESIKKWQVEIKNVEVEKPIYLIMTKKDLLEELADDERPVTLKTLRQKSRDMGCQGAWATSAKKWDDHNVH